MIASEIASWIQNTEYDHLSKSAVDAAKSQIIDTMGVCIRGSSYSSSKALYSSLEGTANNPCTFIGLGTKGSSMNTALFNGTSAHSVEMDDFHNESIVHPGVVVIPASFALAEELGLSGSQLLLSTVIGYEIMIRVGLASRGTQQERGFHPTGTCGPFGSTAAASKLLNLTIDETAQAFGIAGSYTGGLLEFHSTGAWTKRLHAGLAARTGLLASRLAKSGFTGPETIFDGQAGFLKAYCNQYDLDPLSFPEVVNYKVEEVSIKPYSSCRFTHSPIDGLIAILNQNKINANEISEIIIETHDRSYQATIGTPGRKYHPCTQVDGQFSLPFCLALAAHYRYVHPEHFTSKCLMDENLRITSSKVKAYVTEEFNQQYPRKNACKVTVKTEDGEWSLVIDDSKGDPKAPLSRKEINEKFVRLSEEIIGERKCRILLDKLNHLESIKNVKELFSL